MANAKIQRVVLADGKVRLHEAVSDSVYVRGTQVAGEGTLTEVLDELAGSAPGGQERHRVSLLHISDNHHKNTEDISQAWGIKKLEQVLEDDTANEIALAVHTGDLGSQAATMSQNVILAKMVGELGVLNGWNKDNPGKPILFVKGNHDAIDSIRYESDHADGNAGDNPGTMETKSTEQYSRVIMGNLVTWGDDFSVTWKNGTTETKQAGYWYKDVLYSGVKLRIIGLDEYQRTVGTPASSDYTNSQYYRKVYSQEQIDWLIATLKSTPSDAYIILLHHQPVYGHHPESVVNNFTHHGIFGQEYDTDKKYDGDMFTYGVETDVTVHIIDAYQRKALWSDSNYPSGAEGVTLNIVADFRDTTPAKFACHLSGHVHGDFCEYVPGYPLQLSLTVMSDNPRAGRYYESYSDLVRSTDSSDAASYAFNKVTIDADRDVVRVERIGANTLKSASNVNDDGTKRDSIEFQIRSVDYTIKRAVQSEAVKDGTAAFTLDSTKYHVCDSAVGDLTVALPASAAASDEFLFSFTCASDATTLALPTGVEWGNGLDFDADKAWGRRFQVSIMDGIALYAYVEPSNNNNS